MIDRIDHIVLTVRSLEATLSFYEECSVFGGRSAPMRRRRSGSDAKKLTCTKAIGLFEPKAASPTPGARDFCLITLRSIDEVISHLKACGVNVVPGPVTRIGAEGRMTSVYFRDPDANLIEIDRYD